MFGEKGSVDPQKSRQHSSGLSSYKMALPSPDSCQRDLTTPTLSQVVEIPQATDPDLSHHLCGVLPTELSTPRNFGVFMKLASLFFVFSSLLAVKAASFKLWPEFQPPFCTPP